MMHGTSPARRAMACPSGTYRPGVCVPGGRVLLLGLLPGLLPGLLLALLGLLGLGLLGGCAAFRSAAAVPVRAKSRFRVEWRDYQNLPGEKAIAVAGDREGRYVCGIGYGAASTDTAVREALERCEQRRADRRITDACRTYAVGDSLAGSEDTIPH